MNSGDGHDTFVFRPGLADPSATNTSTITDFTPGEDKVDLSAYGFATFQDVLDATDAPGTITLDPTTTVSLNIDKVLFSASDFLLV